MLVHSVQLPLGVAEITLDRRGLDLADRGGFEARWVEDAEAMDLESYRKLVKNYLNEGYRERYKQDAPKVTLNLASYQFIEDVMGWSKLNYGQSI